MTTAEETSRSGADRRERADRRTASTYRVPPARHPNRVAVVICVVGLLLTLGSTYATAKVDHNTEQRLLDVSSKQVGAVLSAAVLAIQAPLATALSVQPVAGPRDIQTFTRVLGPSVGPDKVFVSASLWQRRAGRLVRLATVGAAPIQSVRADATLEQLRAAFQAKTFTARAVSKGDRHWLAYAQASEASGYAVYAERAIPASRRSPVDRDSAFADLHYAIYLGPRISPAALQTTDVAMDSLPLEGTTSTTTVPFGDSVLTIVTSPRRHLGAALSEQLPLVLLLGGLLLTAVAARTGQQLVRRRIVAEEGAATITGLYDRVEASYGELRELSVRLQRALLPAVIPEVGRLETAAEYVAGAQGVDIGGDWYSMIGTGEDTFAFVVGDVSGRGVDAVASMAHARFTLRAYLVDGDSPAVALAKCSHQFDITADGHLITVVVGVGNWRTGELTLASAGHPAPLVLRDGVAGFIEAKGGPPLGVGPTEFPSATYQMVEGEMLMLYTDGLIERRAEVLDIGMDRLAGTVEQVADRPVADIVAHALTSLRDADAADDIAILAFRWGGGR